MSERIRTPIGEMWMDDGVLWHRLDQVAVDPDQAAEVVRLTKSLTGDTQVPTVVDIRSIGFANFEARAGFAGSPEESGELATALIVQPGASEAMAQLFTNLDRPRRPVAMFTDEAEAVAWVRSYLPEE